MKGYDEYIYEVKHGDSEKIISTEKGDFSVLEIMSMSKYQWKKQGIKEAIWGKETVGHYCLSIRKLAIRREIIHLHSQAIENIASSHFPRKEVIYVNDYNDAAGDGPCVANETWDGKGKVKVNWSYGDYATVRYADYDKIDGYYFFNVADSVSRVLAFDEKGFGYFMFGNLNHEQKVAVKFIDYIGESFESMKIKTRHNLTRFTEKLLQGKYGEVTLKRLGEFNFDSADASVKTQNGDFCFLASFSCYVCKDFMREILSATDDKIITIKGVTSTD